MSDLLPPGGQQRIARIGKAAGNYALAREVTGWVADALSRPDDTPPKGFEFVPTDDDAERRPVTRDEIDQRASMTALITGGGAFGLSRQFITGASLGSAAYITAQDLLRGETTPANHYLTGEDLDRINGVEPHLP